MLFRAEAPRRARHIRDARMGSDLRKGKRGMTKEKARGNPWDAKNRKPSPAPFGRGSVSHWLRVKRGIKPAGVE